MPYSNNARVELTRTSAELEEALKPITAEMNGKPLRVNRETWLKNLMAAEEEMLEKVNACRDYVGWDIRPNSPADCSRALFSDRKIAARKVSKASRRPSLDADTLAAMENGGDKLAGMILEARGAISRWSQLKSWKVYAEAGAVQPIWDSNGQPQGRYTSDSPCLNNRIVPIRETIEPDPGYSFLSLDLGQAEYVVWASLSQDEILGDAFKNGRDFHSEMAHSVREAVADWNLRGEDERQAGKMLNFAILYRMTEFTLARKLGCDKEVAGKIIQAYYNRTARAKEYIQKILDAAKLDGYVETAFGRRRYCPEYNSLDNREAQELEKTLWHHHNAGTAAEILKMKQVQAWSDLRAAGLTTNEVRLALNMYDEVIFMVRDDLVEVVRRIVEPIFRIQMAGFLPMPVTVKVGKNWKEVSK